MTRDRQGGRGLQCSKCEDGLVSSKDGKMCLECENGIDPGELWAPSYQTKKYLSVSFREKSFLIICKNIFREERVFTLPLRTYSGKFMILNEFEADYNSSKFTIQWRYKIIKQHKSTKNNK